MYIISGADILHDLFVISENGIHVQFFFSFFKCVKFAWSFIIPFKARVAGSILYNDATPAAHSPCSLGVLL